MGSQQLLIIAVGIVIVGLMIYSGFLIIQTYFENSNRDQLIATINDVGVMAQQYVKKPIEQGGGGGTFTGWLLPTDLSSTDAGKIRATITNNRINLVATGTELGMDKVSVVRITAAIEKSAIRITVTN